jgi:GT2 family glycosyltransferase
MMNSTPEPSKPERVSIVSAVDEHLPNLQVWFQALCSQTLSLNRCEIIVIDATHETDYEGALKRFRAETEVRADIRCHRVQRGGRAQALNRALELATGDLIIFLGDDCLPPPGFAEAHLQFHESYPEAEAVGVGSAILAPEYRTPFSVWLEESGQLFGVPFSAEMTQVPEDFFYVGNSSVKRKLLDRAGRFNERFAHHAWDDFEFGKRLRAAGMKAQFVADARVEHIHCIDLPERERIARQAGAAVRVYESLYPENHSWLKTARSFSWLQWLCVTAARCQLAAAGTDEALVTWWLTRLKAAVACGYRKGVET